MSDKTDAWMPLWIGAYLADTQHLSRDEHGAYLLLLMAYWRNGGPLPDDDKRLAAIAKASPKEWKALRLTMVEFFAVADGFWTQKRVESELAQSKDRKHKAVSKAQAAAGARWGQPRSNAPSNAPSNDPSNAPSIQQALHEQCPTPTPTPTPDKKTKTARKRAAPAVLVCVDDMVADGVDRQCATDWLVNRKGKDLAPLTPTIWQQTKAEAGKANLTIAEAIKTAAGNGWGGFKASWLSEDRAGNGSARLQHETQRQAAAIDRVIEMTGGLLNARRSAPPEYIDAERTDIPALG